MEKIKLYRRHIVSEKTLFAYDPDDLNKISEICEKYRVEHPFDIFFRENDYYPVTVAAKDFLSEVKKKFPKKEYQSFTFSNGRSATLEKGTYVIMD